MRPCRSSCPSFVSVSFVSRLSCLTVRVRLSDLPDKAKLLRRWTFLIGDGILAGSMQPQQLLMSASRSLWLHRLQASRGWSQRIQLRLNAVHVGRWPPDFVQRDRVSYDHELECLLGGSVEHRIAGERLLCHGGEAVLRAPGALHSARVRHGPVQRICFHFDWDRSHQPSARAMPFAFPHMDRVRVEDIKPTPEWVPLDLPLHRRFPGADWRERLLAIPPSLEALDEGLSLARLETTVTGLLLELLDAAAIGDAGDSDTDAAVLEIKALLDARFDQDLSLAALAREQGISASQLSRSFKRVIGLSPSAYLQELRMQRAMHLLVTEATSVAAAGMAVGIADPKYFARVFSRRWGMPPSQARLRTLGA